MVKSKVLASIVASLLGVGCAHQAIGDDSKLGDAFANAQAEHQTLEEALGAEFGLPPTEPETQTKSAADDILSAGDSDILGQKEEPKKDELDELISLDSSPAPAPSSTSTSDDIISLDNKASSSSSSSDDIISLDSQASSSTSDDIISLDNKASSSSTSDDIIALDSHAEAETPKEITSDDDDAENLIKALNLETSSKEESNPAVDSVTDLDALDAPIIPSPSDSTSGADSSLDHASPATSDIKSGIGDAFAEAEASHSVLNSSHSTVDPTVITASDSLTNAASSSDDLLNNDVFTEQTAPAETDEKDALLDILEKNEASDKKESEQAQALDDIISLDAPEIVSTTAPAVDTSSAPVDLATPTSSDQAVALSPEDLTSSADSNIDLPPLEPQNAEDADKANSELDSLLNEQGNNAAQSSVSDTNIESIPDLVAPSNPIESNAIKQIDVFANAKADATSTVNIQVDNSNVIAPSAPVTPNTANKEDAQIIGTYLIKTNDLDGQLVISATGNVSALGNSVLNVSLSTTTKEGYGCHIKGTAEISADNKNTIIFKNAASDDFIMGTINGNSIEVVGESESSCSKGAYFNGTYVRK